LGNKNKTVLLLEISSANGIILRRSLFYFIFFEKEEKKVEEIARTK
jgi:hypothetical protein